MKPCPSGSVEPLEKREAVHLSGETLIQVGLLLVSPKNYSKKGAQLKIGVRNTWVLIFMKR